MGISQPSEAAGGDSCDSVRDSVAVSEFFGAVRKQADERAVDVAVAEEAEVVCFYGRSP